MRQIQEIRLNEFALTADLPKNKGAKIVQWNRFGNAASSNVIALTEGGSSTTTRTETLTGVSATLVQFGDAALWSDIVSETAFYDIADEQSDKLAEECALKFDEITRNVIVTSDYSGTSATTSGITERYSQGFTTFASFASEAVTGAYADAQDFLHAATNLKVNRAKPFSDGCYIAIVPPQISDDLQTDPTWTATKVYQDKTDLYKGELGRIFKIRFVEATTPFRELATGTSDQYIHVSTGSIYSNIVFGQQAFGVAKLNSQSPYKPKVVFKRGPDSQDLYDQTQGMAYKFYTMSKLLNANFAINLRSKTRYA